MRRQPRLAPALVALVAPVLVAAAAAAVPIPGLQSDATVAIDTAGVPHVTAGSERDAVLVQGYLDARDRFFQMDLLRRTFSGTLAELVGPAALPQDVQLRTLGLRRAAEASWQAFQQDTPESADALTAYAQGVNAWLASNPLPIEHQLLELTGAAPWTPVDSLVIGKGLAFGLSFDLVEIDLTVALATFLQAGAFLGFDGAALFAEDLYRSAPMDPTVSVDEAAPGAAARGLSAKARALQTRAAGLARAYRERIADVPVLAGTLERRGADTGSNWWVLAGSRTESGRPILANDPHLGLDVPAIFHQVHLRAPADGLDVIGVGFAGVPYVVLGSNRRITWGATTNPMDVTDVYLEELVLDPATGIPVATLFEGQPEPLVLVPQTFLVNQVGNGVPDDLVDAGVPPGEGGVTFLVPRRHHGPLVAIQAGDEGVLGLSVQYTGFGVTRELETFRRFAHAADLDGFRDALQFFDVGSQNWAYADVAGNVAYFASAEMPLREDLQILETADGGIPPFLIRDGTHALRHEWLPDDTLAPAQAIPYQTLPFDELPQVVNPPDGVILNANNDPVGTTLDNDPLNQLRPGGGIYYLSPGYADLRAGRIRRELDRVLADGGRASVDEVMELQANHQLLDAELLLPHLTGAFARAGDAGTPAALQGLAADPRLAEAIGRLDGWDFSTPTGIEEGYDPFDDPDDLPAPTAGEVADSVAATIWSVFRGQLVQRVVDDTLAGLGLADLAPGSHEALKAVHHLLATYDATGGVGASGVDFFAPGVAGLTAAEERDLVLLESLDAALDLLASPAFAPAFGGSTDQDDYRWGRLHRIVFDHPLGPPLSIPPGGGFDHLAPDLPGLARSGGYQVVDASSHGTRADGVHEFTFGSGPARRFVGTPRNAGLEAFEVIPGGQSGDPTSPFYASQLGLWLTNRYEPVRQSQDAIDAATAQVLAFEARSGFCVPSATTLCLHDGRFAAEVAWSTPDAAGLGRVATQNETSGVFTFFGADNWELLAKVLDGCAINDRWWVFLAAATNVAYEVTVTDTVAGTQWTEEKPFGPPAPAVTDVEAFACP